MFQIDKQKKLMRLTDDQEDIGKNILDSLNVWLKRVHWQLPEAF